MSLFFVKMGEMTATGFGRFHVESPNAKILINLWLWVTEKLKLYHITAYNIAWYIKRP